MSSVLLIVDDNDKERFAYTSDWQAGGSALEYQQTMHATSTRGATVSFTFNGSWVEVVGTIGTAKDVLTTSSYTIDGQLVSSFTAPNVTATTYQQRLFATDVPDGQHTLLIAVTSSDAVYRLDYVSVGTSVKSIGPSDTIVVDDADTSRIQYDASWILGGSGREVNRTTHYSITKGATVQFPFTGTHVLVAGTVEKANPVWLSFYMDGVEAGKYSVESDSFTGVGLYQHTLFSMDVLDGDHTLSMTLTTDTYKICLDYFLVTPGSTSITGTSIPTGISGSVDSSSSRTPVGAIAGGVIGGILVLAALFGFFLLFRRRKGSRVEHTISHDQTTTPFPYDVSPSLGPLLPTTPSYSQTTLRHSSGSASSPWPATSPHSVSTNAATLAPSLMPMRNNSSVPKNDLSPNKAMKERQGNSKSDPRLQHYTTGGQSVGSSSVRQLNRGYSDFDRLPEYTEHR